MVIAAFVLIFAINSMYINNEYERSVVTRLGEFSRITGPGLHFKAPFIESRHVADTRISSFNYEGLPTATADNQIIGITLTINHRILSTDEGLVNLFEQFGSRFSYEDRILRTMAVDRVKGVVGKYTLEEFTPKREQVRQEVAEAVRAAALEYGIFIADVQLSDVQFSTSYKKRLEEVARARAAAAQAAQDERRASFVANAAIEEARGKAESARLAAEAEAYSVEVRSMSQADAIRREGEAKADALKAQAEVLKNSNGLIELTKAERWNGVYNPQVVMGEGSNNGGFIPFMNMNEVIKK